MSKASQRVVHKTTIGGQSILEGIMMKGPRRTCTVVRRSDGGLAIEEKPYTPLKETHKIAGVPVIRGFVLMVQSLIEGFQAIDYSSKILLEDEEDEQPSKLEQWFKDRFGDGLVESVLYFLSILIGVGLAVGLFILLPALVTGFLPDSTAHWGRNLLEGVLRIFIFIAYMALMSLIPDMKRTFRYHGAEHKTIRCYEACLPLTVENVRKQTRLHPRCGTSFLLVVMVISILVFSVASSALLALVPGLAAIRGSALYRVTMILFKLLLLPVVVGITYEINRWAGKHDNWFTRIITAPGMWMQNFTTNEPDDSMIEVGIAAVTAVLPEKEGSDLW